jgi:hypothetical protein
LRSGPADEFEGVETDLGISSSVQAVAASRFFAASSTWHRRNLFAGPDNSRQNALKKPLPSIMKKAAIPPLPLFHGTAGKTVSVKLSHTIIRTLERAGAKDVT